MHLPRLMFTITFVSVLSLHHSLLFSLVMQGPVKTYMLGAAFSCIKKKPFIPSRDIQPAIFPDLSVIRANPSFHDARVKPDLWVLHQ